jgi:hypothetical protein
MGGIAPFFPASNLSAPFILPWAERHRTCWLFSIIVSRGNLAPAADATVRRQDAGPL